MKRAFLAIFFLGALAALGVKAQLPAAWQNWQHSRPIALEPASEPRLVRVVLPMAVYGQAQASLADVRVIDDAGNEVPHVLYARPGQKTREWRSARLSEVGFVPGRYTTLVVDTGEDDALHNSVEIETDEKDFMVWVEIAASDDRKSWRVVRERAPIYRFEKDGLEGAQTISYPETRSRWLRVRILEGEEQFPVRACRTALELVEEAERTPLPANPELQPDAPAQESRWQVDLGVARVPVSAVRFEAAQAEFHRAVRVSMSEDGKSWRRVGSGAIYRYREPRGDQPRSSLQVEFREARGRYWRVTIFNRNDVPIEGLRVQLAGTPRHVVFRQQSGGSYRLLYGNSRVKAPEYELARLTAREELEVAFSGSLGEAEINSAYVSPEPWSERHPVVLWVALGIAVAVLGWLALRSLRTQQ